MDLSSFAPILALRDELRRELAIAAPPETAAASAQKNGPPLSTDAVASIVARAATLRDAAIKALDAPDPASDGRMAHIVTAATTPLPTPEPPPPAFV
jgi:hypothetical protein